jgi:hypothetical protein
MENLFPMPEIELRFHRHPAHSLVALKTKLSQHLNVEQKTIVFLLFACYFISHIKEEHRLGVCENRVLRGVFKFKKEEVTGG